MISKFFIENPIFASVISIVIVIAGAVSVGALPVATCGRHGRGGG